MTTSDIVSLVLSGVSALATFYFWLVKSRKEHPHLGAVAVDLPSVQIKPGTTEKTRWLGVQVRLAVTNLSLRPDVLTAVAVRVRDTNRHWAGVPAAPGLRIGSNTPLPIKLASFQSVAVVVWLWVEVPAQGLSVQFHPEYLEFVRNTLPTPLRFRVELRGLGPERYAATTDLVV